MTRIGFDNEKYVKLQSQNIRDRISQFGGKLYLEFGGKLFDDYHAARVLPGFEPDSKVKMLLEMKDDAEIVIVLSADDIERAKRRGDLGITYDEDDQTLEVYRRVLEGEIPKYPRNFFVRKGSIKLCVMLMQYISTHMIADGPEDLYRIFSDHGEGNRILREAKLYPACRKFFKSPLEFVHTMLTHTKQANPLLYNYYSFKTAYEVAEKEVLRSGKCPKSP